VVIEARARRTVRGVLSLAAACAALALATGCGGTDRESPAAGTPAAVPSRNPRWAQPLGRPGLPNLHKVSDTLYRGAQPDDQGWAELGKMGVRTVVSLRSFHSDRSETQQAGLAYEHIYMKAWHPEYKEIVRFLRIVSDPDEQPVFVHCRHGADRTGTMCAVYRIIVQDWTVEDAIDEMRNGDYGFHEMWSGLPEFLRDLDIEAVRRDAGLDGAPREGP